MEQIRGEIIGFSEVLILTILPFSDPPQVQIPLMLIAIFHLTLTDLGPHMLFARSKIYLFIHYPSLAIKKRKILTINLF